jgi:hypothetical protein
MTKLKRPLPEGVANWINTSSSTAKQKEHLTKVAAYLVARFLSNNIPFDEPLDVSREHFRHNCGTGYLKHLQQLERDGILQVDHNYKPGFRTPAGQRITLGQCKRYLFAPDYIFTDAQVVQFTHNSKKQFDTDAVTRQTVINLARLRLSLRESEIKPYLEQLVTAQYIRDRCKVNDEIEPGSYKLVGTENPRSLEHLRSLARRNNCDLILYRDKAFLAVLSDFVGQRRKSTVLAYLNSLLKLKNIRSRQNIECKRNDTNLRLDTNLTNLKSELLQFVTLDGEHLVSTDLANSQPTLLAHLMSMAADPKNTLQKFITCVADVELQILTSLNVRAYSEHGSYQQVGRDNIPLNATKLVRKTAYKSVLNGCLSDSCKDFIKSTKNGTFYDVIAKNSAWVQSVNEDKEYFEKARAEAKQAMFVALFAAAQYNPPAKKVLAELYPGVVHFTNSYKRKMAAELLGMGIHEKDARDAGKRSLAITLQLIESRIFIDGVLARLLREGYRVFTKHDSILCKASELAAVTRVIRAELDSYLGPNGYTLKTEHHAPK